MIRRAAADLFPGYFALVMATGIVSIAADLVGVPVVAAALLAINVVAYAALWSLTGLRVARYPGRLLADLRDHARGPGFLTIVAGTCVLGAQCVVILDAPGLALALLALGAALWLLLMYGLLANMSVTPEKPSLERGINGGWLLMIVATQAVSILGTLLSPYAGSPEPVLLVTLGLFFVGCMLYILVISLIFYRILFFPVEPAALTPPYWINMGAVAITTLAGSLLMLGADRWIFLADILPFLKGFTVFFWATATWWIPLLVILGIWRHAVRGFPLSYEPQLWSMVFPLGMYTASTYRLIEATGWAVLDALPRLALFVALTAWGATFVGLLRRLARAFRPGSPAGGS